MPQLPAKPSLSEADFETIASAVKETERGRWFLDEYARRNRHADTKQVLEAIEKLQHSFSSRGEATQEDSIRLTIADMADAIARTKAEIAAIKPSEESQGKIGDATVELDAIVSTTEQATSEILSAAENVQEIAWTLREQGTEPAVCDQLDALMTQTYSACSFQDLTGQRIRKIVNVLNFLEARIEAMNLIWGKHETPAAESAETPSMEASLLNGPALPGHGLQQFAVDEIIDPTEAKAPQANPSEPDQDIVWEDAALDEADAAPAAKAAVQTPPMSEIVELEIEEEAAFLAPAVPAPQPAKAASAAPDPIESLSPVEKLALFS
jgi:chemotaxis regulatin CheY-phosphate phosphatase CheZ